MMSFETSIKFLATLCLFGAMLQVMAQDKCQTCMDNIAYCVNETSFHLCYEGDQPEMSELFHCSATQKCTNSSKICEETTDITTDLTIKSVCDGGSVVCSTCGTNATFACLSKTQYARCVNNATIGAASCKADEICSIESYGQFKKICLPQSTAEFLNLKPTCSNDVTTTAAPPTTVSTPKPDVGALRNLCNTTCINTNFCYASNIADTTCKSYLYCELQGAGVNAEWNYVILKCSTGVWNATTKACDVTATCPTTPPALRLVQGPGARPTPVKGKASGTGAGPNTVLLVQGAAPESRSSAEPRLEEKPGLLTIGRTLLHKMYIY